MPILVGAVVGAVVGGVTAAVVARARGRPITWRCVLLGAFAGAVGGAITTGVALLPGMAAGTGGRMVSFAAGGVGDAVTEQVGHNLADGRDPGHGVDRALVAGSSSGLLPVAGKLLRPLRRVVGDAVHQGGTRSVRGAAYDDGATHVTPDGGETAGRVAGADDLTNPARAGPGNGAGSHDPGAAGRGSDVGADPGHAATSFDGGLAGDGAGLPGGPVLRGRGRPAGHVDTAVGPRRGSASSDDTPGGSAPGGSAPGGSAPGGSAPGGSAPGGTAPGGSAPGGSAPGGNALGGDGLPGTVATRPNRGLSQVLDSTSPPARGTTAAGAARAPRPSVHGAPPPWLLSQLDETLAAVRAGRGPRDVSDDELRRFFDDTWQHANEVNELVKALGGRPRPLPDVAPRGPLRGVHDFGERVSVRRVDALIAKLDGEPLRDRAGNALPVPDWLRALPRLAREVGEETVDIGKLSPEVAAGLSKSPPDPFSLELHRLSPHHQVYPHAGRPGRANNQLIENVADKINAMRQWRFYKEPMPFAKIREILLREIDEGVLPAEARDLVERALRAQQLLERLGRVNPYYTADGA